MKGAYSKSVDKVLSELKSRHTGLTDSEAKSRLKTHGENVIKDSNKLVPIKIFFSQFNSFLIYILLIASSIMFVLNHFLDSGVIFVILLLNGVIGFFQQYKAEKAISNLKKLIIPISKVLRDNKIQEIPSSELVLGDVVILNEGDKVNADCRIIEAENLKTNEATLTGESLPIHKSAGTLDKDTILAEQKNMLFAGTQVVGGSVTAVVVATGMNTSFGKIANTLQNIAIQKTPMQKRLDKFSKQLGFIIMGLVFVLFILGVIKDFGILNMFITAVALAIGAIPEGLPAVLAISFAISSTMLSKKNVIIRRLPAVESLGSVTVLCSDKTGTITEEKMQVQKIFVNNNFYQKKEKDLFLNNKKISFKNIQELGQIIKTSILCNNARFEKLNNNLEIFGEPTEKTLLENALDFNFDKKTLIELEPSVSKFEFSSKRKMMSVLRNNGRNNVLYSKGAPEKILSLSSHELFNGNIRKITSQRRKYLLTQLQKMENDALRVLGFAYKNFNKSSVVQEDGLIFIGFIGMMDPPRKEVKDAIAQCKSAGIKIKMITGDSELTAIAIARQVGIVGKSITETELEEMTDSELAKNIDSIAIFARTTPHQKLRITKILQKKGEVVGITGDGVNDVLALKSANIGIAMGKRGTDIARDVSDIVLIDDNFASLVEGVKQGRQSYDNIKKFTKYMLSVNFYTILLVGVLSAFGLPLPILPLQILWQNLVTDSFPAITLVFEKEEHVMKTKPRKEKSLLSGIWKFIIFAGILNFIASLIIYFVGMNQGLEINHVRSIVLTTGILFELLFVYVCRSDKLIKDIGIFSNKWLNYAIVSAFALHLILLYTSLGKFFDIVPLGLKDWLYIVPLSITGLLIMEGWKWMKIKKINELS